MEFTGWHDPKTGRGKNLTLKRSPGHISVGPGRDDPMICLWRNKDKERMAIFLTKAELEMLADQIDVAGRAALGDDWTEE